MDMRDKSIKQILLDNGFIVTDKKLGGWDNTKRMIIDNKGNELGYYSAFNVVKKLCKEKT